MAVIVLIVGVAAWLAAGTLFKLKTKEGVLVLEVNEPNAEVFVDGERVTVTWGAGGKKAELRVKPGTRKVEVKKEGFTAHGEKVTPEDGGHSVLTARLYKVAAPPPEIERKEEPPPPAEKADAKRPPANGWISIMPGEEDAVRTGLAKYSAGVLEVQAKAAMNFSSRRTGYEARNAALRTAVKKLRGENVSLNLRVGPGGGYHTYFTGGRNFGVGKHVTENGVLRFIPLQQRQSSKAFHGFFEYTFRAEDDLLTVEADGEEVLRVRDSTHDRVGAATFGVYRGTAQYRKAEIRILDGVAAAPPAKPARSAPRWLSIMPTKGELADKP